MKIGQFAKYNHISIDTIRHYMDLGLIISAKDGGHYAFDDRCQNDLEAILSFKDMGFTLNEIKSILAFKRFGSLSDYQTNDYYKGIFVNKHREVSKEIENLTEVKDKLEGKIEDLSSQIPVTSLQMGVELRVLSLLKCANCGSTLNLSDGHIAHNQIIEGKLTCNCGKIYKIEDGILCVETWQGEGPDFRDDVIIDYVRETPSEYLDNVYEILELIYKPLNLDIFKGKVLLDLGVGMGFFLRHIYSELPDDTLYIAVDHDIRRHRFLKNILEKAEQRKNILFICCDFLEIPIKDDSIDIVLDFSGSSNYAFDHEEFLLGPIDHYIKKDAYLIGGYIIFKNFIKDSLIEKDYRKNFMLDHIKDQIEGLNYQPIVERTTEPLTQGGKHESYFKKGEKVYSYAFYGKR